MEMANCVTALSCRNALEIIAEERENWTPEGERTHNAERACSSKSRMILGAASEQAKRPLHANEAEGKRDAEHSRIKKPKRKLRREINIEDWLGHRADIFQIRRYYSALTRLRLNRNRLKPFCK